MATYTKTTDFLSKDSLPLNNAAKYVKGSEIDTEYNNIATADADNMKKSAMGTGVETFLGTPSSANLAAAVTGETGTGALVFATSPTLVTPALGTPASGVLTNCTGLPAGSITGLGAGIGTFLATPSSANLATAVTDETGSGGLVFANTPTLVTPVLGTPTSGTLTNCTGLPVTTGISGLGANVGTFLATPSSANLASAVTDETGSGKLVFDTSPTLVTPTLGIASATSINKTAITAPATGSTLAIADGKTLTVSNTITLVGTDSTTYNLNATGGIALGTPIATTSGTDHAFTGLPAGIKQIKFMLKDVSKDGVGNANVAIFLGDATTGGYVGSITVKNIGPSDSINASVTFSIFDATNFIWVADGIADVGGTGSFVIGNITLAGALDRIKINVGSDAFDTGSVNISYIL
jgi:hypothetical protein